MRREDGRGRRLPHPAVSIQVELDQLDLARLPERVQDQGKADADQDGVLQWHEEREHERHRDDDELDRASVEMAEGIAANAPLSNFAVMHALPRIADMAQDEGLFVESLMAAIASGDEAAKTRVRAFLEGRAAKVQKT